MPRLPRNVKQSEAIRAMIRLGGVEIPGRGKGSHRSVLMPNRYIAVFPMTVKTGLLSSILKASDVSVDEFIQAL